MLQRSLWILTPILSMGLLTGPVLLLLGWRARASSFFWPGAVYTGAGVVSFLMNEDAGAILRTLIWIFGTIHCLIIAPAWLRDRWWAAPVQPQKARTKAARVPDAEPGPASAEPGSPAALLLSDPGTQAAAYYAGAWGSGGSGSGDSGGRAPGGGDSGGGAQGSAASGGRAGAGSSVRSGRQIAGAPPVGAAAGALLLNVNAASERDLQQLPGIGRQRAARTVRLRREEGPFLSLEDYGQRLNLGPQGTDRLRGRVSFGAGPPSRSSNNGFGRKVDY